jgi:ADP-ribose pyrophosphatase YjhB (NUDIX family)
MQEDLLAAEQKNVPRGTLISAVVIALRCHRQYPRGMANRTNPVVELIARGVLIERGRLLVCRSRKRGHCFLPGGHVEFGETAAAALEREMREELGAPLRAGRFLGVCEASFVQAGRSGRRRHHEVNLVFAMSRPPVGSSRAAARGRPKLASIESKIEFDWLALDQLRGRRPPVRLLPPGILPLMRRGGQGSVLLSDWR